jgi:hypothetical protein
MRAKEKDDMREEERVRQPRRSRQARVRYVPCDASTVSTTVRGTRCAAAAHPRGKSGRPAIADAVR